MLGDLPQQHGLATSLVERLHTSYKEMGNAAEPYHCKLVTNHRCHKEIVKFCNSHFYADQQLRSDIGGEAGFPFHFVCSNMELRMNLSNHDRVYKEESRIIVDELLKVYGIWPKSTWGQDKDCSQIVITGATRAQVSIYYQYFY